MLNNCQPVSVTAIIDEQDVVKINNDSLHVKGKPVFSWIRNPNNNTNTQISKPNIILSTDQLINHNTNNNKENPNQAELKGVQNLKNLWNTRIRAFKDTKFNTSKTLSPAKSCGCLLQEGEAPQAVTKALSLHNCAEIKETTTSLRLTKDNFYKYKRAETIENNKINNNLSPSGTPSFTSQLIFNFPLINATKRGDKIHWMRRDTLPSQRKHSTSTEETPPFVALEADNEMNVMTSSEKFEASPATLQMASTTSPQQNLIAIDNNSNDSSQLFSETRDAIGAHYSSNSPRSIESTTSRRKNVNSNRKYSFKTQVKSYHSPRKMPYYNNSTASNKVAKLTQQFNEIIQKDKKILAEVKRKNGILLSRGGHVYKVIENSEQVMTATQATVLPNKKDTIPGPINGSTVQRAIKTFESKTSEKPKVPVKSAQVLKKKKELTNQNVNKGEFKDAIREQIQIEEKINSRIPTLKPVSKDLSNDCVSNVNKVVQGIENNCNRKKPKTELIQTELRNVPCAENQIDLELIKKNRYAKIYEKFRFRGAARKDETAESTVNAKLDALKTKKMEMKLHLKAINIPEDILNSSCNSSPNQPEINSNLSNNDTLDELPEINSMLEIKKSTTESIASDSQLQDGGNQTANSEVIAKPFGEFKILSALEEVNQKLEILTKQSDTNSELKYSPNESFLYQGIIKAKSKEDQLFEAVNTSLVNFTEAKTLNNLHKSEEVNDIEENTSGDVESGETVMEESIYEIITPINPKVTSEPDPVLQPQKSFLFCNSNKNSETCITGDSTNIKKEQDLKLDSYDTCNNYESINGSCEAKTITSTDDGYEICENPDLVSPPRPPKESTELQRNTTDKLPELPELPKPKRIIPKKAFTAVITSEISSCASESGSINDEENIYDTIKGAHHSYEVLQKNSDTISLTSNPYESINNYRKQISLRNAGSSSTISSDHKTNSLYEVSMVNGTLTGCQTYSFSYHTSSENSDDWVDISDSEVNAYDQMEKQQFIVIRERMKHHRSPDWSKRVRDKRLNQAISDDDDVDHFYEPLFVHGNKYKDRVSEVGSASTPKNHTNSHYVNSNLHLPDDYDSFDTDDDVYEDENGSVKKNDIDVDISKVKLPNPPPSKNQVYEFVKRVKNFMSYKKSPSDPNKSFADSIQAKMYENTQFQVEGNEYQSTLKPTRRAPDKPKTPKARSKKIIDRALNKPVTHDDNIYENTDFHNQNMKATSQLSPGNVVQLSTSEKNLIAANDIAVRSKSKTGKSFKSRLKSLGAVGFDNKQLSTLTTARSTFYISEITSNEQDSGIFEKTSSGDITLNKAELEPPTEHRPITTIRKNKKETNSTLSSSYRRRTTIGMRPNDPPPPPPLQSEESKRGKQRPSTTSWYAECGVFKVDNNMNIDDGNSEKQALNSNKNISSTSWYAEAGLYQTSGISVASSSGSSGVSTANEGIPGDDSAHHVFLNEPLYQIYNAEKLESISRDLEEHESADGYEEIGLNGHRNGNEQIKPTRPSALQLVGPRSGPSRTLWSEIPEVISSEILPTLTPRERSLQEAKFEIITSEASYLKSLNLLRSHFMNHQTFHDTAIISSRDRKTLFSYIAPVHECSEKLLSQLESCWQDNIMLLGLSKRIYQCAEKHFHVYVSYCEHQGKMDRTLRKLKEAKSTFSHKLDLLEADPLCCGLTLHSFLMLPMQRITRLPLLIDAVFSKVHHNDDEYENWKLTLAILNKIVAQCNDAANRCEQSYEIERISRQLEFPSHIRALAIAPAGVSAVGSKPRFLVKKGELVHLIWRGDDAKLTFGKKFAKSSIYAFLFSDLMVLTKRKGEEQFTVFDYCPRNMLTISSGDAIPQLPTKDTSQTSKNLILMTLLENYEKKTVELVLSCPSVSELERWLQATRPPKAETPGEKLYEQWDCPQVIAKHEYVANEPDLLSLEVGDVVNVSRKLPDGWFSGERIRDGAIGWFPGTFTEEVNSAHVRARNLKQRYRLLTFTATYLELQKRK